jgi:hypothetical protein
MKVTQEANIFTGFEINVIDGKPGAHHQAWLVQPVLEQGDNV